MSIIDKMRKLKAVKDLKTTYVNRGFLSTGVAAANVLLSGSPVGGLPIGKITMIAGISSSGKSLLAQKSIYEAQKKGLTPVLIDSEEAYQAESFQKMGIDTKNLLVIQEKNINKIEKFLSDLMAGLSEDEMKNVYLVIDSWGLLMSQKSYDNAADLNKDSSINFQRTKALNALARFLTGFEGATILVLNHCYASLDQYSDDSIPGGSVIFYVSSSILMLTSKAKEKEDGDVTGALVRAKTKKSRFAVEETKFQLLISHTGGFDPWYGLLEDAIEMGHVLNNGIYYRRKIDGESAKAWRRKEILAPETSKSFWMPIFKDGQFVNDMEAKYSFKDRGFMDDDWEKIDEAVPVKCDIDCDEEDGPGKL